MQVCIPSRVRLCWHEAKAAAETYLSCCSSPTGGRDRLAAPRHPGDPVGSQATPPSRGGPRRVPCAAACAWAPAPRAVLPPEAAGKSCNPVSRPSASPPLRSVGVVPTLLRPFTSRIDFRINSLISCKTSAGNFDEVVSTLLINMGKSIP